MASLSSTSTSDSQPTTRLDEDVSKMSISDDKSATSASYESEVGPYGIKMKRGKQPISHSDHCSALQFIESQVWRSSVPGQTADVSDPLLCTHPGYGEFMMAFDFHLTPDGPRLIEINTNADGIMTAFELLSRETPEADRESAVCKAKMKMVEAIKDDYRLAMGQKHTGCVKDVVPGLTCIVDECVQTQRCYPEYMAVKHMLEQAGLQTMVVSPEELLLSPCLSLEVETPAGRQQVNLIYNRISDDKRLLDPRHEHIRRAAIQGNVVLTPHPAVYSHVADKALLTNMKDEVVPETVSLCDRTHQHWWQDRQAWVFKPSMGFASRGVVIGSSLTQRQLRSMTDDYMAQRFVSTAKCKKDGSYYDLRFYTYSTTPLAIVTRHFTGSKMSVEGPLAGMKLAEISLPVCDDVPSRKTGNLPVLISDKSKTCTTLSTFRTEEQIKAAQDEALRDKEVSRDSTLHQADIYLRKLVGEVLKESSRTASSSKTLPKQLSNIKKEVLKHVASMADVKSMEELKQLFDERCTEAGVVTDS